MCVCVCVGWRSAEGRKCYKVPFNSVGTVARSPCQSERVLGESLQFLGSSWGHLDPGGGGGADTEAARACAEYENFL